MLIYFVIFCLSGVAIGKFINDRKIALSIILGLALLWGIAYMAIWGLVTVGELLLGYFLFDIFLKERNSVSKVGDDVL